jgi:hypothetical protein
MGFQKKPRRVRCTWCGELDYAEKMHRRRDAANLLHYFHKEKCWEAHVNFMNMQPTRKARKVEHG